MKTFGTIDRTDKMAYRGPNFELCPSEDSENNPGMLLIEKKQVLFIIVNFDRQEASFAMYCYTC